MAFIKKTLIILAAIVVFVAALLAGADNSDEVALQFLDFQTPVWPISWWMLTAFVLGVLFGTALNVISNTRLRINARNASREAQGRTRELDQARAQGSPTDG